MTACRPVHSSHDDLCPSATAQWQVSYGRFRPWCRGRETAQRGPISLPARRYDLHQGAWMRWRTAPAMRVIPPVGRAVPGS